MPRGSKANIGDVNVSANGYHYTRTEAGWKLTHHIIAEKILGRKLVQEERVSFKDGDRTNLDPSNIEILPRRSGSIRKRLAIIEARIQELEAEKLELEKQLEL